MQGHVLLRTISAFLALVAMGLSSNEVEYFRDAEPVDMTNNAVELQQKQPWERAVDIERVIEP